MSLTRKQEERLMYRLRKWSAALIHAIREHSAPNTFGVTELAGEYSLTKRHGYQFSQARLPDLEAWVNMGLKADGLQVTLQYKNARFIVEVADFMVLKLDATGRPCAWGVAKTEEAARAEADRQLAAWISKQNKAEVFEPFSEEIKPVARKEVQLGGQRDYGLTEKPLS